MKMILSCLIAINLTFSSFVWPIGRTGNGQGLMDQQLGFYTKIPNYLFFSGNLLEDNKSVALKPVIKDIINIRNIPFSSKIIIKPFTREYPELVGLLPQEIEAKLKLAHLMNWQTLPQRDCIHFFISTTKSSNIALALWGKDKGIILIGSSTSSMQKGIRDLLDKIELEEGACSWN